MTKEKLLLKIVKVFRNLSSQLNGDAFKLYIYYQLFNYKGVEDFKAKRIAWDTGMTSRSINKANDKLLELGIITKSTRKVGGQSFVSIKVRDKINFEQDADIASRYIIFNNILKDYMTNSKSKKNKNINKHSIKEDSKVFEYYKEIKRCLLDHPRFNHNVYKCKFQRIENAGISNKELNNIKRVKRKLLIEHIPEYTAWWIKENSKTIKGFSFGMFGLETFLDDFLYRIKKIDPYKKEAKKKKSSSAKRRRIQNLKKRIDAIDPKDIKDFEMDFLKAAEEKELVELKGRKFKKLY